MILLADGHIILHSFEEMEVKMGKVESPYQVKMTIGRLTVRITRGAR